MRGGALAGAGLREAREGVWPVWRAGSATKSEESAASEVGGEARGALERPGFAEEAREGV